MQKIWLLFLMCILILSGCSSESEKYMELADQYFVDGQYDYAAYNYIRVLEMDRDNEKAYMNLIDSYIAQEKVDKALDYIKKAEEKFGVQAVEGKQEILKGLIEKEMSNPTPTEVPSSEYILNLSRSVDSDNIETNLEYLKSYIQSNGSTNGDGNKLIELSDNNCKVGIAYNTEENLFEFGIFYSYSDIDVGISYSWNDWMEDSTIVDAYLYSSINANCATSVLDISNYNGQDLEYTVYDIGGFYTKGLEENVSTVLNSVFKSGMNGLDLLLLSKTGMHLSDIGFISYPICK